VVSFAIVILLTAFVIPFFIWNSYEISPFEKKLVSTTDSSSDTYLVSTFDGSFTDETWGEYDVTIYYPAVSSGISQHPDRSEAPYPAIVFAHGFTGRKEFYTWIGNCCATRGYVTILFTIPTPTSLKAFSQSVTGIRRSINYLLTQNEGGLLEGMIDKNRIGVMGHSMGAMAVLIATPQDSRIRAAVSLAPGYFGVATEKYVEACKSINVPIQLQAGSLDWICPPSAVRVYYDALTISPKEMVVINGAEHIQFSDASVGSGANITLEEQHRISQKYFIAWFNYYLYDDFSYYTYIFGDEAQKDLDLGILSELRYVEKRDNIRPSVAIASPPNGALLASTSLKVIGTASDNVEILKVEVSTDNSTWTTCTGTTSWSQSLTLSEGLGTIYVKVTDTSGNENYDHINVIVDTTKPSLSIKSPKDGETSRGTVEIIVSTDDENGIEKTEFYVHGHLEHVDTTEPYSWSWDTTVVKNEQHMVKVLAYDKAGNIEETSIKVRVDNKEEQLKPAWIAPVGVALIIVVGVVAVALIARKRKGVRE